MSEPAPTRDWQAELAVVDDLMRFVSAETDPQRLVLTYGDAVEKLFPVDLYLALSRRGLDPPFYRITRNSRWKDDINPWTQKDRLPLLSGGILGQWLYDGRPVVLQNFEVDDIDPQYEVFKDMRSVLVIPHYDGGQAINLSIMMWREPNAIDVSQVPGQLWRMNLFGRTTHNLVLRRELAAAYDALDRELQVVGEIQRSLLPGEIPVIPGLQLATHYRTSQRAGGDYYDLFPLGDDRWGLFIADVSGHGTPAAVMMAVTHAIAHSHPHLPDPPDAVLARLNHTLHRGYTRGAGTFVTAFYGVFDARTRVLRYASAGHNPPLVLRADRVLALDQAQSLPLGILDDAAYPTAEIQLQLDDALLLYTDGITEAMNSRNELFGFERLAAAARGAADAAAIVRAVTHAVEAHTTHRPPADDQTLLVGCVR